MFFYTQRNPLELKRTSLLLVSTTLWFLHVPADGLHHHHTSYTAVPCCQGCCKDKYRTY
jgi:hypothetical protein